ncbi:MAG: CocE/NonD family hydrolase [Hypericibacter sp.]
MCDVLLHRDMEVTLRDGTRIYVDIYRPVREARVPALLGWGPFGKGTHSFLSLDALPERFGVPLSATSGYEAWEAPDPAYWCARGYAVVQPDPRGVGLSEGLIQVWNTQEARDEYDLIEWLASQDWCSGKIGLTGCSWLAASQWLVAAQRPPSLTAIAPWQGLSDYYRDQMARGGIPAPGFMEALLFAINGDGQVEDCSAMLEEHPLFDKYWADKVADFDAVDIPAYIVTPYSDRLHTEGTFRAYRRIRSAEKWLRVHNSMEWPDYYKPENVEDLRRFFDCFLKGVDNGWRDTAPVRLTILDNGHTDVCCLPEQSFPPQGMIDLDLFLDAQSGTLCQAPPDLDAHIEYSHVQDGSASFTHVFDQDVDVIGYPVLTLWVHAEGQDDLDVFVQLEKLDADGAQLFHRYIAQDVHASRVPFYAGPDGRVRASRRAVQEPGDGGPPVQLCTRETPLRPGEIVRLDVPLSPIGMRWHRGEQLRLVVGGRDTEPQLLSTIVPPRDPGDGRHVIHTGGEHPSSLSMSYRVV